MVPGHDRHVALAACQTVGTGSEPDDAQNGIQRHDRQLVKRLYPASGRHHRAGWALRKQVQDTAYRFLLDVCLLREDRMIGGERTRFVGERIRRRRFLAAERVTWWHGGLIDRWWLGGFVDRQGRRRHE